MILRMILHCSEDEDALLLAELAKGKKEKEMAKLKEVYCWLNIFTWIDGRKSTNGSKFESRGNASFQSFII